MLTAFAVCLLGQLSASEMDTVLDRLEAQRPRVLELARGAVERAEQNAHSEAYLKNAKARAAAIASGISPPLWELPEMAGEGDIGFVSNPAAKVFAVLADGSCLVHWRSGYAYLPAKDRSSSATGDAETVPLPSLVWLAGTGNFRAGPSGIVPAVILRRVGYSGLQDAWKKRQASR